MNSIRLYYIEFNENQRLNPPDQELLDHWVSELNVKKQKAVLRLLNDSDRIASLSGLQLLKLCALDEQLNNFRLSDVEYPEAQKPYWSGSNNDFFDFNISHSGRFVIVAVSRTLKLGVDIEKHRKLKNMNFKMVMSTDELQNIKQVPAMFFDLWCRKEAVVKAANTAGIARMRDVRLKNNQAELDGETWQLEKISGIKEAGNQYSIYLATSAPVEKLIIKQQFLNKL